MQIYMTNEEQAMIRRSLEPNNIMLEWGSGGSTLEYSKYVKEYHSIEHDMKWYMVITSNIKAMKLNNVSLYYVKNNLPRSYPHVKKEEFIDYINHVNIINKKFDRVLIDGRARIWCAYEVLQYLNKNAIVFVHDWEREEYHKILDKYKLGVTVGRLAMLVPKEKE